MAVLAAVICLGGDWSVKERQKTPLMREAKSGDSVRITGQVYAAEMKSDHQVLYLKENTVQFRKQKFAESKIIIYDKSRQQVKTGNKITAQGEIRFYEPARNPGNFDAKKYYERQGIHACMWSDGVKVTDGRVWRIRSALSAFRQKWKKELYKAVGAKRGALLGGIILGDKAGAPPEMKELYQVNGIGHILAISGLHLSFIGLGMYRVLRRLSGSYLAGGIGGILFLSAYILMIGVSVSAVRALVMLLFRVGADMAGRHYDTTTALAAAAVVVLLWRPLALSDGGFWLSFGAVFGVTAVLPLLEGYFSGSLLSGSRLFKGLCAGASINITILPVLLYCFYEFPPYSLLLNLLVIPLLSAVLFLGMAGSAVSVILYLPGKWILTLCGAILDFYEWLCRAAAELPGSRIITGQPPFPSVICYYALLFAVLFIWSHIYGKAEEERDRKYIAKYVIISVVIWVSSLFILLLPGKMRQRGELEVTMLDVGQGDGLYMQSPSGQSYLFDGGSSDVRQAGKYRIEPFLRWKGIGVLDYVFISHGDSDHMNGISEIIQRGKLGIQIRNLILPPEEVWDENLLELEGLARESGIRVLTMRRGQCVRDGELTLYCLHPDGGYEGEPGNGASMAVWAGFREFDMLFTGDVEGEGEKELTEALKEGKEKGSEGSPSGPLEVLKVAHHGSKNSTSAEFLEETAPRYGFISAGQNSRYGHPHRETVERLTKSGCRLYSTQKNGAVTVRTDGVSMKISAFLSGKQLN